MNTLKISVPVRETNLLDHIIESISTSPSKSFLSMFLSVNESSDVVSVDEVRASNVKQMQIKESTERERDFD